MGIPMKPLKRRPGVVNIVFEVGCDWAEETAEEISKFLNTRMEAALFKEGFSMSWYNDGGREPSGEFLEKDNFNLVIVSHEPFGGIGLMAPCIMDYITNYLSKEGFYCPEKTAIIANPNLIRLNNFLGSPKLQFFSNQDFEDVAKFLDS